MERISYQDIPEGMFDKLRSLENFINASPIDMRLLELMRLRVAQMNGCAYCVDMHNKELKHAGETDLRLYSLCIWKECPYYSEKERLVLHFTEILTRMEEEPIPEGLFDALKGLFSKEEISYLTLAVAQINTWTRLMKAFRFSPGKYQVQVS